MGSVIQATGGSEFEDGWRMGVTQENDSGNAFEVSLDQELSGLRNMTKIGKLKSTPHSVSNLI